jgi:CheY-like chemotaxis protein
MERIFEPFVQAGGQTNTEGTGLGLAITRQYVELMGGELAVESKVGKGSVFRFEIPVEKVAVEDIEQAEPSRGQVIGLEPGQPNWRILIVEDQLENRLLLNKLLEQVGFEVREALNGQEAIEVFEEWRPHFIWMDRRMPLMDGLEATRRIKAMEGGKETIIVALTASVFKEQRDEVLEAGCDDFLRKPFREVEIFDAMEKHLSVRYVYAEEQPMTTAEAAKMDLPSPEVLAALPPELLASLSKAVEEIDLKAAEQIISRIGVDNKALAKSLANLVKDFRFDTLQNLVMESMK